MSINRREAIRNLLVASAGTVFLTGFAPSDTVTVNQGSLTISKKNKKYLAQISETILPINGVSEKIGSPGDFIVEMLNHSYDLKEIKQFAAGFEQYKALMKASRLKIKSSESEDVLPIIKSTLEATELQDDLIFFINTTKNLSVWNLTSSEYYMTDRLEYKLIPGKHDGCKAI